MIRRSRGLLEQTQRLATMAFCGHCTWTTRGPGTRTAAGRHARTKQHPVRIVHTDATDLIPTVTERH